MNRYVRGVVGVVGDDWRAELRFFFRWLPVVVLATLCAATALAFVRAAHAQALDPLVAEQAYLTADPIDPGRLGLATPAGRYAIRFVQGCDDLGVGQNVWIWPGADLPPWLPVGPIGLADPATAPCLAQIEGRMDTTPCFANAAGLCDAALEQE